MKAPSPLLGFNNNVRHKGRVFHIQTEDSGIRHPHVITHLFADGGRILKTTKTSYAEHIGQERIAETVRAMMQEQHKAMFIALRDGRFDYLFEEGGGPMSAKAPPKAAPPADARTAAAPPNAEATSEAPSGDGAPKSPAKAVAPPVEARADDAAKPAAQGEARDEGGAAKPAPKAAEVGSAAAPPATAHDAAPPSPVASPGPASPAPKAPAQKPKAPHPAQPEPSTAPPPSEPKRPPLVPPRRPPPRPAPHVPPALANALTMGTSPPNPAFALTEPQRAAVVPTAPQAPVLAEAPAMNVATPASRRRGTSRPTLDVDPGAIHGVSSSEPSIDLDLDALERAAAEAQTPFFQQIQDLPPPPASVLGSKRAAAGGGYSVRSPAPPPFGPDGARPPPTAGLDGAPRTSGAGPSAGRPAAPAPPIAAPSAAARYAPSRPASIFATTRPQEGASIFGEDLISEKSLDEVILGYLAEDLDAPTEKK